MHLTRTPLHFAGTASPRRWSFLESRLGPALLLLALFTGCKGHHASPTGQQTLLNVSFDVSRDLFTEINNAASPVLESNTGHPVEIRQSHGGASKQARSVIEGMDADVVTLNTVSDIDLIARRSGLISTNWRSLKPQNSAPYSSVVVFLVRPGNPKHLHDWSDLTQANVTLAMSNPKSSGSARVAHLSAWAHALGRFGGDEKRARQFLADLYARVPVLDTGARGATITFVDRQIGDALITLEAEQWQVARQNPAAHFEVVYPSISLEVEMPVAVVERIARKHHTWELANRYLDFLYTPEGQEIIARNHFRPRDPQVRQRHAADFPALKLADVDRDLGGWDHVTAEHFAEGGLFDQVYDQRR